MNEFIVWDDKYKIFIKDITIEQLAISEPLKNKMHLANWSIFNYIGLKDIEDDKIYADSSIVEFEHFTQTYIVTFHFDLSELKYFTRVLSTSDKGVEIGYEREYSVIKECDFKIIDTIQENKLGLIK